MLTDDRPTCPRCGSPDPMRHPAMQLEGEVQVCPDPFHPITEHTITDEQVESLLGAAMAREDIELVDLCETALKAIVQPNLRRQTLARIAAIVNTRSKESV